MPAASLPPLDKGGEARPEGLSSTVEVLRLVLKIVSEREGIAPRLVASTADLEAIAAGDTDEVPALQGWRRQVFGEPAEAVRNGTLAIALEDGRTVLVPREARARSRTAKSASGV
jgi:ribonuclease D